ncbi:hypothetical protein Trydic_g19816, partial [Trypoxylus dichotomus]
GGPGFPSWSNSPKLPATRSTFDSSELCLRRGRNVVSASSGCQLPERPATQSAFGSGKPHLQRSVKVPFLYGDHVRSWGLVGPERFSPPPVTWVVLLCREDVSHSLVDSFYLVDVYVLVDGAAPSLEGFGEGFRFVLGSEGDTACPMDRRNGNSLPLHDLYCPPEFGW